tara:strand:+ start:32 stop:790 length:759 start_codon:yes stop_codon:yes gene_type:complete
MKVLPLFKSQYSLGRSILTLEAAESSLERGPDSIVDLALENDLKKVFLIDDTMSGFLQGYKNLAEKEIKLVFGLRVTVCPDMGEKNEDSRHKSCKYIVLCKNEAGYKNLIKIASDSSRLGFYYEPRIDFKTLKQYWSDDLTLCVPFYDSFLYKNLLTDSVCIPDFDFTTPTFFEEDNDLPFDQILQRGIESYCSKNNYETISTKSVYYAKKKHFKAYLTFRCINKRSTLDKPELEHMGSHEFSMESWREQNA